MNRTAAVLALLLLAACSKKDESKGGAPPSTPGSAAATSAAPVDDAADAPAPPDQSAPETEPGPARAGLSLSANDSTRPVLFQGWPLVVRLHADPGMDATPAAIEVLDGAGTRVPWPLAASGRAWTLSGVETAKIAAGSYRIRATAGGAADEIPVEVKEAPATPTPQQARERFTREAQALLQAGKADAALELARKRKGETPGDPNPTILEGDALRALGKTGEAAAAYRRALEEFRKANPKVLEAPVFLLRRLAAVEEVTDGK